MKYTTIYEATRAWVNEFNAIPQEMIGKLMQAEPDDWQEVTAPTVGDSVYVYDLDDAITLEHDGEIIRKSKKTGGFTIRLYDGTEIITDDTNFEVEHDDTLPMWGTMWQFDNSCDNVWLEENNGIELMSDCGFRIYEIGEFGYIFGIDGAGYSFMETHFIPLYKARGLHWHGKNLDKEAI